MELRDLLNRSMDKSGRGMQDEVRAEVDGVLMEIEDVYSDQDGVHLILKDDPDY